MNINPDGDLIIILKYIRQFLLTTNRILKTLPRNAHTAIYFAKQKLQSLLQYMLILPVEDESYMNDEANSEDCYNLKKVQKCAESERFSSIKLLCYVLKRNFILRHM